MHAVDEAIEAEDEDVAVLGVHLDAGDDEKVSGVGELVGLSGSQKKSCSVRQTPSSPASWRLDEVVGGEVAVVGKRMRVGMEVD